MADEEEDFDSGFDLFDEDIQPRSNSLSSILRTVTKESPSELTEVIEGYKDDLLEGLYSSFFLSTSLEENLTDDSRKSLVLDFLKKLPPPYQEMVSVGRLDSFLSNELNFEDAVMQITKNLTSGVSLEPTRFWGEEEKANTVAKQVLICYPGEAQIFTANHELFPVGHRAEKSYIITWPNACAVLTFLGWD